jgi:Zn-dependent protease with chaperone function
MANFFERQEKARRHTTQLVVIYGVTVLLLVLGLYASVVLLLEYGVGPAVFEFGAAVDAAREAAPGGPAVDPFRPWVLVGIAAATLVFIGLARTLRLRQLRRGGEVVARRLNGRRLDPSQAPIAGQKLTNVVEEMAIAAGAPAPPVYVLPEQGINAFSAGFGPDDAVIGVTQGALDQLDRDELQGVVAHELSHILNGDTRLKFRLMGWTHGLQLLSTLGRRILHALFYLPVGAGRALWTYFGFLYEKARDVKESIGGFLFTGLLIVFVPLSGYLLGPVVVWPLFVAGMAALPSLLFVLGTPLGRIVVLLTGTLAGLGGLCHLGGLLIKARVSRAGEFLADAAAVEFTRNPAGIGGALLKLRNCEEGGTVQARSIAPVRHLFFGDAVGSESRLPKRLSAHPPIEARIRRIDSALLDDDGTSNHASERDEETRGAEEEEAPDAAVSPEALVERAGTLSPEMLAQARALHASMADGLLDTAHQPLGAVAICYALVLDSNASMRSKQFDLLWERVMPPVFDETKRLYDRVADLDRSLRLPLVEVAAPSLRDLSAAQQEQVRETIQALAEADDRITLFEFALQTIVRHSLPHNAHSDEGTENPTPADVQEEIVVLLSGLAQAGHAEDAAARATFDDGYGLLVDAYELDAAELTSPPPDALDAALNRLARAPLALRKEILQACAHCAMADNILESPEETLLRAVAVAMGVPLPVSVSTEVASPGAMGET